MLRTGLSVTERYFGTTLLEVASKLLVANSVPAISMLGGSVSFTGQSVSPFANSISSRPIHASLTSPLFEVPQTERVGRREVSLKAFSTDSGKSQSKNPSPEKQKLQTPARRVKQASKEPPYSKLTDIRGVGPKNAQLLAAAGYADIDAVRAYYLGQCSRDQQLFQQHLQNDVGIKLNLHQQMIAKFIQESADFPLDPDFSQEALQQSLQGHRQRNNVTLSVEGNISAGKSTFLKAITDHCPALQSLIHVSPEPVDRWQNVNSSNGVSYNLLDQFYHDKKRYAYIFQNYIFFTRMMQEKESSLAMKNQPYRLLERSIFCDRMVFVESLKDSNFMSEMELTIYNKWFDPMVEVCPTLVPDGFIYLRATPGTCMDRMMKRSRNEETGVGIDYLEDLHKRHEDWLYNELRKGDEKLLAEHVANGSVLERPGHSDFVDGRAASVKKWMQQAYKVPKLPDLIASDVQFLNKNNNSKLHSSIHSLPALVLDCEKDLLDLDAQQEHASKVNAYLDYVKETRKQRIVNRMLEQPMKERNAPLDLTELHNGLMKGADSVPEEWRSELREHISRAMQLRNWNPNSTDRQLVHAA